MMALTMAAALRLGASEYTVILFCAMQIEYYLTNWTHSQMNSMGDQSTTLLGHSALSVHEGLFTTVIAYCVNLYDAFFWRRDVVIATHPPQKTCAPSAPARATCCDRGGSCSDPPSCPFSPSSHPPPPSLTCSPNRVSSCRTLVLVFTMSAPQT